MRAARARRCGLLGVLATLAVVPSAGAQSSPPADTPAFQAGAARAGRVVGAEVRAPLARTWSLDAGVNQQGVIAAGGRVFLRPRRRP